MKNLISVSFKLGISLHSLQGSNLRLAIGMMNL